MTRLRAIAFAVTLAILGVPLAADAASPTPTSAGIVQGDKSPAMQGKADPAGSPAGSLDETYASREANAKGLETFEGGGAGVYISGGAATVLVVLLVIIIVL